MGPDMQRVLGKYKKNSFIINLKNMLGKPIESTATNPEYYFLTRQLNWKKIDDEFDEKFMKKLPDGSKKWLMGMEKDIYVKTFYNSKIEQIVETEREKLKAEFLTWIDSEEFDNMLPAEGVDEWVRRNMSGKVKEMFKKVIK